MKKKTILHFLATSAISSALLVGFGALYLDDHAWGTWGDDSAGYIFLAGRLFSGEPLIYTDDLGAEGIAFFGDEQLARWLIPTHHQFINPSGTIASKYPLGTSLLMVWAGKIWNSAEGFYLVNPLLAAVNLVLMYLVALVLFLHSPGRHLIGLLSACFLGFSSLYFDHAIAQPMREIPSMTFLLLLTLFLLLAVKQQKDQKSSWMTFLFFAIAGASFGMAFNIRETSVVILPGVAVFLFLSFRKKNIGYRKLTRFLLAALGTFFLTALLAAIPTIQNSIEISKEKVVFKPRDTSQVVLLSNIGHLKTLSIQNFFNNPGKFRSGEGALLHFWTIVQQASPIPYFLVLVALGILFFWKKAKAETLYLSVWGMGMFLFFSLWINPYARYLLPVFPVLMWLGSYGLFSVSQKALAVVFQKQNIVRFLSAVVILTFGVGYLPRVSEAIGTIQSDVYRFKAISRGDLHQLIDLAEIVRSAENPLVMFTGNWQHGISETFQAHTSVKAIRSPFEQRRFIFDPVKLQSFFDSVIQERYDLFVWVDDTSSPQVFDWLMQYNTTRVALLDFTFQPDVLIYRIEGKITPSTQ